MSQSMSHVGKCIDNGPMEGFWGILKRERYYGKRFTSREALVNMIEDYITYYNTRRLQRGLGVLTPLEKYELYFRHKQNRRFWLAAIAAAQNPRLTQCKSAVLQFYLILCLLDGLRFIG